MTGFINLDKPVGKTSFDMVAAVRRMCPRKTKVGHAGTLDPFATGVLLICIGKATRLACFLTDAPKQYRAGFTFGATSDTDDCDGEITPTDGAILPSASEIEAALTKFTGAIQQVPPAYSAIHVNGQRAYKMARKGEIPKIAPREVFVESIKLESYADGVASVLIDCGKGAYIRSIARDLGQILGCGAYCSSLRRTAIGKFTAGSAITIEQLSSETIARHIMPPISGLDSIPHWQVQNQQLLDISHGKTISADKSAPTGTIALTDPDGQLAAICDRSDDTEGMIKPRIVLVRPEDLPPAPQS